MIYTFNDIVYYRFSGIVFAALVLGGGPLVQNIQLLLSLGLLHPGLFTAVLIYYLMSSMISVNVKVNGNGNICVHFKTV